MIFMYSIRGISVADYTCCTSTWSPMTFSYLSQLGLKKLCVKFLQSGNDSLLHFGQKTQFAQWLRFRDTKQISCLQFLSQVKVKYQLSFIQSIYKWENNINPPMSVLSFNFISETAKRISFKSCVPALRLRSGFNLYSCWSHENQVELYNFFCM